MKVWDTAEVSGPSGRVSHAGGGSARDRQFQGIFLGSQLGSRVRTPVRREVRTRVRTLERPDGLRVRLSARSWLTVPVR